MIENTAIPSSGVFLAQDFPFSFYSTVSLALLVYELRDVLEIFRSIQCEQVFDVVCRQHLFLHYAVLLVPLDRYTILCRVNRPNNVQGKNKRA